MNATPSVLEVWTVLDKDGVVRGHLTHPGQSWLVYLDDELAAVTKASGGLASLAILCTSMVGAPVRLERGFDVLGALGDIRGWLPDWRDALVRDRDLEAVIDTWRAHHRLDADGLSILRLLRARARRGLGFETRCVAAWGGDEGLSNVLRREGRRC